MRHEMTDIDPQNDHSGDETLIVALASGLSVRNAAKRAAVSESTAFRRLRDPAFRQRVDETRGTLFSEALGRLADAASEAVNTLRGLLGKKSPPAVRLAASRAVLDLGVRMRDSIELESRMRAMEERLTTIGN